MVKVDIWQIDLGASFDQDKALPLLSKTELERYQRFVTPELQQQHLRVHSAKRQILAGYLEMSAADILFAEGEQGKPYILGADWQFNLSHSGEICLLAVTEKVSLGIDVERMARKVEIEPISRRFFCEEEVDFILQAKEPRQAFFSIWVRKEAVVKMLGDGLMRSLQSFSVCQSQGACFQIEWKDDVALSQQCFFTREWQAADNYKAALVVDAEEVLVKEFCFR